MTDETCLVVELRRYALRPNARETLIELFDREFVETQEAVGMSVLGQFRDLDDPNAFVWLRGFTDMRARTPGLEAFYGGPVWKAHASAANATMLDVDNVLLLRPGSGLRLQIDARAAPGSEAIPPGLLDPLRESAAGDFSTFFARELEPALELSGISVLASYVTEHSPNTFPALPVRSDTEVFVWLTIFSDGTDHAQRVAELEQSPAWRDGLGEALTQRLNGSPEVLRLTPTARSLLHG